MTLAIGDTGDTDDTGAGGDGRIARRVISTVVALLLVGLSTVFAVRGSARSTAHLEDLGALPDFRLTDQDGTSRGLADLAGKWWVADFIFTTCHSSCPVMTKNMDRLRRAVASTGSIVMISFSVDPERDTPEKLRSYSKEKDLATAGWWFLTGPREAVQKLALEGFHLGIQENPANPDEPILHSRKFVLVDDKGHIRGYYDGMDSDAVRTLQDELKRLDPGA